jgi:hypothetical protein
MQYLTQLRNNGKGATMNTLPQSFTNFTLSSGTLRNEDFIAAVSNMWFQVLRKELGQEQAAPFAAQCLDFEKSTDEEEQGYIVHELYDMLEEIAPEGCGFGCHEGDGALIGFWQYEEV